MLPQGGTRWHSRYDVFRQLPENLAEATAFGAAMTAITSFICFALFYFEASAFFNAKPRNRIMIDSNLDGMLRINFDVEMHEISCDYVSAGVWDAFGDDRMNVTQNVMKQRVDHTGTRKGHPYREAEISALEHANAKYTNEEVAELNSDWVGTSDTFKHNDFQAVVQFHDYLFVLFDAQWCAHCRKFAPKWREIEDNINFKAKGWEMTDASNKTSDVRALRVNCAEFEHTCAELRVHSLPAVRVYSRATGDKYHEFNGNYDTDEVRKFFLTRVAQTTVERQAEFHSIWKHGCRVSGYVDARRVQGTFRLEAKLSNGVRNLNLAITNVSHTVHHFTFGHSPRGLMSRLPGEYRRNVNPIDGKTFIVDAFHKAPQHFIKVVHTRFDDDGLRSYQQTHQSNVRTLKRNTTPQARFSYDISPVEVVVSNKGDRHWYDFFTKVLAIVGGAFSTLSILVGILQASTWQLKGLLNKLS